MDSLQVVADPRRREMLRMTWDRELSSGEIAAQFDVTVGAVSQHLGILREAGFVTVRADGNRRLYRADHSALGPLATLLESMWTSTLDELAAAAEADDASSRKPR